MYKELQADVRELHAKLTKLKKEFRGNSEELKRISSMEETELKNYNARLSKETSSALEKAKEDATHDLNVQLSKKKQELKALEEKHKSNLAEMNEDEILEEFREEREIYNEIKEAIKNTNGLLTNHVGCRLKNEIMKQLSVQKVNLEQEELDSFIEYFNEVNEKLDKMNKGFAAKMYNSAESKLQKLSEKRIAENDLNKIILFVLCCILGYVFAKFIMPFYVFAIVGFFGYNLYRSYRLYENILVLKAVQDNIRIVETHIEEMVTAELQQRVEAENAHYDKMYQRLQEEHTNLEVTIDETLRKCQENFKFDDAKMKADFDVCKQSKEDKKLRLESRNMELEQQIKEITKELIEKNNALTAIVDELPKKLLAPDVIGESKLFDCKFLMDIENGKPVYFEHPKMTTLFLYEDIHEVNNFIKLLVYQLRANINPYSFKVTLVDKKHLGNDFQGFVDSKYPSLFEILSSDSNVNDMLENLRLLLAKRVTNIKSTFKNIEEYNKSMIISKSVTESYQFIFYLDMDSTTANNEVFQQLMFAGSDVGFYFHAFQQKEAFYKDASTSLQFLNKVGSVFLIEKGKITTKSREFIKENIVQASNKTPKN